jgi:hypothetical protein
MSCGHGWHGCGPWYGPPYGRGWYGTPDWYEEEYPPIRGRSRRSRGRDPEAAADELEERLENLRGEVRRIEAELANVSRSGQAAPGEK